MMEEFKNTIRNNTGAADYMFYYELKTSKNWEIRVLFDIQQHVILFSRWRNLLNVWHSTIIYIELISIISLR